MYWSGRLWCAMCENFAYLFTSCESVEFFSKDVSTQHAFNAFSPLTLCKNETTQKKYFTPFYLISCSVSVHTQFVVYLSISMGTFFMLTIRTNVLTDYWQWRVVDENLCVARSFSLRLESVYKLKENLY